MDFYSTDRRAPGEAGHIAQARAISNETIANMKQNLAFALVYNSLSVITNALRLRGRKS